MKDFLEYLIKEIATKPEEVKVDESKENEVLFYHIHVAEEDMGLVIGKEGKTIKALRNLAKAKAIKDDVRVQVSIEEVK